MLQCLLFCLCLTRLDSGLKWTTLERKANPKIIPIPRYKELRVRPVWAFVKEIPELLQYFPDYEENELSDRAYLWGVLEAPREDG